jgi:predicted DNA-binding transcriptional regulator YafY
MSTREAIGRLSLIIKKVRKFPATFEEIEDFLTRESELQKYTYTICKRTFQRDLNDIRSLYDIDIKFDRSRKVYYIDSEDKSQSTERILEAFDVFNALKVADRLSDYILFENRRAKGTENLYGLLHAIQNRLQISFSYQKFWEEQPSTRQVEPYALKEFKNRWYLLSNDVVGKKLRIFALDRLTGLDISKRTFTFPTNFNVKEYFRYCFGIIQPDNQVPEQVILSFDPEQGKYIKSLPLHDSQQILVDNSEEFRIKLELYITFDFIMEILSYSSRAKVLEPAGLVEEVKMALLNAYQLYSGELKT